MAQAIFDLTCPEWASVNDDGIWCDFCGELLVASFHVDSESEAPECCRSCGAPDDIEAMAEYFT